MQVAWSNQMKHAFDDIETWHNYKNNEHYGVNIILNFVNIVTSKRVLSSLFAL